ncbi:hypothetical protein ACFSBZ_04020 [Amnibacterium flavum]|uniref:Uncharacterized protein n=1 Tax=Amnibacterium flavum TaxID=2173173 RepID=A0A2V1HP83_9MICO|nr:hypothetical protein [Amnibacterium flavum]PVZ94335.1 hypothetical protein DDQ50_11450 [Amnibacterium flavum]
MRLYSDFPRARTIQIVGDLIALAFLAGAVVVAVTVHAAIAALADFGRQLQESGSGFASSMTDIGATLGDVPLIGGTIRAPFTGASEAGGALESVGRDAQESVLGIASAVGWTIAVLAILLVLVARVLPRLRWSRRAGTAAALSRTPGGIDLLALRALTGADSRAVLKVVPAGADAWRTADPAALRALAALGARDAGVRIPAP